ncbi:unnamed protein product [Clonostachys rhizophaga]|uniref:Choline transport protein n=1 Tax=Clonostachys rhizophaga TaxID=160324 RepID=A0A9N9W2V3_9HYPO|nr:unnamed protein product [Clonostachys rhizophaga]
MSSEEVKKSATEVQDVLSPNRDDEPNLKKRNFARSSMLALCVSLMATWEALTSVMAAGLVSGGPVSLVYGMIVAVIGSTCSAMSLSELASVQPTAGGQYHFVAHLSPRSIRKGVGWLGGYISLLGWIAVTGSAPFLSGTLIQGLLVLNSSEQGYVFERWHGTLIYWAILILSTVVCVFCNGVLPLIQKLSMALHVILFATLIIVMCVLSPTKNSAEFVFVSFQNNSGWESDGVAWCIGLLSSAYVLVGYDGATHLGEEMENAAMGIPFAMVVSVVANGIMGFGFLIALLFCMGDIDSALNTNTGFPIIQIFYTVTGSKAAASVMVVSISFMAMCSTIALHTSASRMLWAFARDQALPWSRVISRIDEKRNVPTVAILIMTLLLMLLGLINIGSTTAFNAILSLAVVGLQTSYLMPICLVLWRRIAVPDTLTWGPWRLGKAGVAVNIVAILYLGFTCIFLLFPPYQPVTSQNMNYASVVLGGMIMLGGLYWFAFARKQYFGPLVETPEAAIYALSKSTDAAKDGEIVAPA